MRALALVVIAFAAAATATAHAQTPTPVPVEEPKPRPVPVPPNAPPPSNDPTPYPVPLPRDPAPAPAPAPAPTTEDTPPAEPPDAAKPPEPAPPPAPAPTPTPPPAPAKVPPPSTVLPPPAPVIAPKPAPMPFTTTKVSSYPAQQPLYGTAKIKKIVVQENTKTSADTVILISRLEVGDLFSTDMIPGIKAELITSGLFKDVDVYWATVEGGVEVHLVVKDKHSWVVAPAFYNQPTNVGGGIGFGENNLFGKNQKLLLYGQIATGDSFFIGAWVIPSLGGTRFYAQLDTYLKSARNIEYAAPDGYLDGATPRAVRESRMSYLNGGAKLGLDVFGGFKLDSRIRAAKVAYSEVKLAEGATMADVDPSRAPTDPVPAPGAEGWDVSNEWTLSIDRRANYYGIQTGYRLAFSIERALGASDFKYTLTGVNFYRAVKFLERHNLVFRAAVNYGRDIPFQQEYSIGGTAMRGYVNSQFRGDVKTLANVEYSVPLMTIKGFSVRGLAFFDSGYTTFVRTRDEARRHYLPGARARGLDPFKNSIGIGTRLYLRQIVLPLLGLDFGYGLEARDTQIYLAIGLTD